MKLGFGCGYNMRLICSLGFLFLSQILAFEPKCVPHDCHPGFFKNGSCGPNNTYNLCDSCPNGYYTEINNTHKKCFQCSSCARNNEPKIPCTTSSNVKCGCIKDYYTLNHNCHKCSTENCEKSECKKAAACQPTPGPTTTLLTTTLTKLPINTTEKVPSSSGLDFGIVWVFLLLLMLPAMYCVSVLLRNLCTYLHLCPLWRDKRDIETPIQNNRDPSCLQNPTTLAFTISEETPMMEVMSPAPPDCPAHTRPLLPSKEIRASPEPDLSEPWPAIVLYTVIKEVPLRRWKEFLRLLSIGDQQLERVELDAGLSSIERQYQMLRLWSQRSSASMDEIYSALHYMDLSGCAQMLKESLEKLQWRPQGVTV